MLQAADINFSDLNYTVSIPKQNEKKQVLKGISGCFKSGELTAIMGPSGAGKSSLLNILTGFTKNGVKGTIKIGDIDSKRQSRKLCSYILQDDNLYPWFTVYETMLMAARLKLSKDSRNNQKLDTIIDKVLDSLNLMHTKQTRCGNLSGGQKKRLSVALEMIDNPPVLFLDEPTTGLDSSASSYCIRLLHNLSREGRTIVCTIHQPSATVYEMFDHVYAMAEGNCIYQGSALNTVPYLSSVGLICPTYHNSADYLLEVANGEYGNFTSNLTKAAIGNKWRGESSFMVMSSNNNSITAVEMNSAEENKNSIGGMQQFELEKPEKITTKNTKGNYSAVPSELSRMLVLMGRGQIQFYRDWTVTHLKLALHILCALVVGLIFSDSGVDASKAMSNVGCILIGILYLWYTTVMPAVLRFPSEMSILKKETFNNWYKLRTYYLSLLITSTPIHIVFATVYSTISFFMTYQPNELDRYLKFVLIHILLTMIADGYGIFFGTIFNPINGTFIGAIMSCYMLAFSGFLSLFPHMPRFLYYISYSSSLRYGLEGAILSVLDNGRGNLNCPEDVMYCHYKSPKFFIEELGMTPSNYQYDILCLLAQLIIVKTIAYFSLKKRLNSD